MIREFGCADGWIGIVRYGSFALLADSHIADGGSIYAHGSISHGTPPDQSRSTRCSRARPATYLLKRPSTLTSESIESSGHNRSSTTSSPTPSALDAKTKNTVYYFRKTLAIKASRISPHSVSAPCRHSTEARGQSERALSSKSKPVSVIIAASFSRPVVTDTPLPANINFTQTHRPNQCIYPCSANRNKLRSGALKSSLPSPTYGHLKRK